MKKYIKKIILVISLVAVLVSSMVIPSFAYVNQEGGFNTWHSFMGDEDILRFPLHVDPSNTAAFKYSNISFDGIYYTFSYVFDPLWFANAGYFNGQVSFRLGGDPYQGTYALELGFFDLTDTNRYQRVSTLDYNVTVEMYCLNNYYETYLSSGFIYDYAEKDKVIFDQMVADNFTFSTNMFMFSVTVPYPSADKYIFNNGVVMCLYPSVETFDEIYKAQLDVCDTYYSSWEEAVRDRNNAEEANESLQAEIGDLEEEISNLTILNEQYKYEASLVPSLSAEVDTLKEQKNNLQNTVDEQKVLINSLRNDLEDYTEKTDALRSLGNGIGDGFSKIIDSISGLGFGNITVGACIAVFVVIFVVFIIIKLVLR